MPIEEIVVKGRQTSRPLFEVAKREVRSVSTPAGEAFERLLQKETTDFSRLLRENVKARDEVIEEIVTTAKRVPKPTVLTRVLGPLSALTSVAEIGAMIADQISQQRLDEAGLDATRTDKPKPDTPLRTIQPETIDEIIVTGKRRPGRPKFNFPTARVTTGASSFGELLSMPSQLGQPRPVDLTELTIDSPDLSKLRVESAIVPAAILGAVTTLFPMLSRRTKTSGQGRGSGSDLPTIFADAQVMTAPMVSPNPLTDFTDPPKFRPTGLTAFQPKVVEFRLPQTQPGRAGFCPPCKKPTQRRKKRRECWKKLVREFADPRRDKEYKWEKIDCKTGRPIKRR